MADDRPESQRVFDDFSALAERFSAVVRGKGFADFLSRAHDALQKAPLHDAAIEKIHTLETRLEKAMLREKESAGEFAGKLAEAMNQNRELTRKLTEAESAIAAMSEHPDVKARVKAELVKRAKAIAAELAKHGCDVHVVDTAAMPNVRGDNAQEKAEKARNVQVEQTEPK